MEIGREFSAGPVRFSRDNVSSLARPKAADTLAGAAAAIAHAQVSNKQRPVGGATDTQTLLGVGMPTCESGSTARSFWTRQLPGFGHIQTKCEHKLGRLPNVPLL
jgi:hypothetical protein